MGLLDSILDRDPDGSYNWGAGEGTLRGAWAGVRNFAGQMAGRNPDGSPPANWRERLVNAATAGSPEDGAAVWQAGSNARQQALRDNQGAGPAATVRNPVQSGPTMVPGSVVGRGYIGGDRGMSGRANQFRDANRPPMRDSTGLMGGRRAEQMPVDDYVAEMPGVVRPPGSGGGARSNDQGAADNGNGPSRLGMGQLGRGGDEALNAASRAMFNRRGTVAEY